MEESLPLAPIPSEKENLEMLSPANVTASAPSKRSENSKPVAPKMNHGASSNSNVAAFSKGDMHLRSSAIVPDKSQAPAAVQPSSI